MSEEGFCAVGDFDVIGMFFIVVFSFKIAIELCDLFFGSFTKGSLFLFFDFIVVEKLIVEIEITFGHYLEKRFSVEVDLVVVIIGLVVDVGVGESA